MQKPYSPPRLLRISDHSEGHLRALLVPLLLCPSLSNSGLYRSAKQTLFSLECDIALRNLRRFESGAVKPPMYTVPAEAVIGAPLFATKVLLKDTPYCFSARVRGRAACNLAVPRYFQLALLSLLHGCLASKAPLSILVDIPIGICIFKGKIPRDLTFPRTLAKLYGGRLLHSDTVCAWKFSPYTQKNVCPQWHPPGADDLLRDPLSVVHLAISNLYSSSESS